MWAAWNGDTPCERMESYYRETQLYHDGSTSLQEYQAVCPGHNMVLQLDLFNLLSHRFHAHTSFLREKYKNLIGWIWARGCVEIQLIATA